MIIPTANEPKALKELYKKEYGDTAWAYQHNEYNELEFRLLADEYERRFKTDDGTGTMPSGITEELIANIRQALELGKPIKENYPEGAIL